MINDLIIILLIIILIISQLIRYFEPKIDIVDNKKVLLWYNKNGNYKNRTYIVIYEKEIK